MTRFLSISRVSVFLVFLPALAFCQEVSIEFDQTEDFSDYKTFAIVNGALNSKNPAPH
jgi:hypothetical protein